MVGSVAAIVPDRPIRSAQVAEERAHLRYRADIDGLRAIAVLSVLFYHAGLGFSGGFVGVDVFFVISGYLITKIIYDLVLERNFSFVEFYDRRVRRLFPALFVMLLAVALWSAYHLIWVDLRRFATSLIAATTYVSNVYFAYGTGYFAQAARTMPLLHTWSLAVEEQFYIVAPFVLFAMARFSPRNWHVPLIVAISVISFAMCVWLTGVRTDAAFYLLPPRAWELGIGGALAIAAPQVHRYRWVAECLTVLGAAAILYAVFQFSEETPFPGWHVAIPTLGTAAILSTGGRSGALLERLLATTPFVFVGKISYSLYLWHWPVIVALTYGAVRPITAFESAIAVALSFALAAASWWYVERPFRTRRVLGTATSLLTAALIATAATIGVGLMLRFENGYRQEFPPRWIALLDRQALETSRPECHLVTPQRAANDRLCVRGAKDVAPTFVFVGDSHAQALSDGLFAAARARGLAGVQFTANGFTPLPGRRSVGNDFSSSELTPAFVAFLRRHPEIKTVVLTSFWSYEATGLSYRHKPQRHVDSGYDGSGLRYNAIALRNGLYRLVGSFPNRRFVLLDDVPSGTALNMEDYLRALYSGERPPAGIPASEAKAQRATYEPILKAVADSHDNVTYLPVLARICGPEVCPLFNPDGVPLLRNGDHLSRFGSMELAPSLGAVFAQDGRPPRFEGPLGPGSTPAWRPGRERPRQERR